MENRDLRVLIINDEVRAKAKAVIQYATEHPFNIVELKQRVLNGESFPAPGDSEDYTILIPDGYKIVFTHEIQPIGLVAHMSVSVDTVGRMPSVESVDIMLMQLFDRPSIMDSINSGDDILIDMEEFAPGHQAATIIWRINPTGEPMLEENQENRI